MKNISLKVVKMGILSVSMASGLALAGGYDLEDYASSLTTYQVQDYSAEAVGFRSNNGFPPFDSIIEILNEIPDSELKPTTNAFSTVLQSDIESIVDNMRRRVNNTINAIGLHSGAVVFKNNDYEAREVRNSDGSIISTTNNISWYPDYLDTVGMRITTGDFNLGAMPFSGKARLDIPLSNIKKQGTKIWFISALEAGSTALDRNKNFYKVLWFPSPIADFYGYYDTANGEWKIKFIIDNNLVPQPGHPQLKLKVFAKGTALQK